MEKGTELVKKISKLSGVLGLTILLLSGCGHSERNAAVKNIEEFSQEYEQAKDSIAQEKISSYQLLGESVQALLDIAEKDSGNLETKEQITQTNELVEELRAELYGMTKSVEESKEDSKTAGEVAEVTITFRNDSKESVSAISILDPQSKVEKELGSFMVGSRIETTVNLPVDALAISWYLYNENGECIEQQMTQLADVSTGATIYYAEDGIYTEFY